jgi:DNA-binding transcriptional ArsR family regulator
MAEELEFGDIQYESSIAVIRVLDNRFSQAIIKLLHKKGPLCVSHIYIRTKMLQYLASVHLGKLRKFGLVKREKVGKEVYYSLNYERFAELDKLLTFAK